MNNPRLLILLFLVLFSVKSLARETVLKEKFQDWNILITQDEWGDDKNISIYTDNLKISINPEFGFVSQDYNFRSLKNYWPHCDIKNFAYRIDGGKPVNTRMGGEAARGAHCATISIPKYMLNDMKKGNEMQVRAGYSNQKLTISLKGFTKAWNTALKHCKKKPDLLNF